MRVNRASELTAGKRVWASSSKAPPKWHSRGGTTSNTTPATKEPLKALTFRDLLFYADKITLPGV